MSVVIPVHNEAGTLKVLIAELRTELNRCCGESWEVIVVDDGSTDEPARLSVPPQARVRTITLPRRGGSGHARRIGSQSATGERLAWIDADGTYRVEDLIRLLARLDSADQVIGVRQKEHGSLRTLRRVTKWATCQVASRLWRTPIPDLNSGLRVFRRESLTAFLAEIPDGFSCVTTATLAALNQGQKVSFVPIGYHPRRAGAPSKFHPVWDTLRLWRVVVRQSLRRPRKQTQD